MESEQLENTANEALRAIIDNAAAAKEFILAELPEVVQQLLMWKMAESAIIFIICLSAILGTIANGICLLRYLAKGNPNDDVAIPWGIGSIFITVFGIMIPLCEIDIDWLQIWIAPKVYLLEYAASLVK